MPCEKSSNKKREKHLFLLIGILQSSGLNCLKIFRICVILLLNSTKVFGLAVMQVDKVQIKTLMVWLQFG
jgi:hypothetical protein